MRRVMVRYKVKPDRAAENEALVRAVYEELAAHRARRASLRDLRSSRTASASSTSPRSRPRTGATRWPRWRRSRASRRASASAARSRRSSRELREIGSYPMAMTASAAIPSCTWSCTPATAARERVLLASSCAGAPSGSTPAAAPTSRSGWAGPSAAASSSAAPGARCGCPTSRSSASTRSPSARGQLGASVLLAPREGPAGWRSVVATPDGGEIAFWQPKARRRGAHDRARAARRRARGDEAAFGRLVEPHRAELHAHCYRMLGSVQDAEDALQEALLRAWRGLARFEGRSSLRSWLYTIATNACLKAIERRPKLRAPDRLRPRRRPPRRARASRSSNRCGSSPTPTSAWASATALAGPEARYEQRESVELAFIAALQHLPARQRAVLILRDVLGFSGARGRRGARDDARLGLQRPAARAPTRRRAAARAQPAGDAARARRRARCARSSTPSSPPGSAATSTRSPRC